jgi:hypothetical protein
MNPWTIAVVVLLAAVYAAAAGLAMWSRHRTPKMVRCPVDGKEATVMVARAGLAEALGCRSLRQVRRCSRWPGRQGCGQGCLAAGEEEMAEVEAVPMPG